jgi:alcohol dehydrogenase class IV
MGTLASVPATFVIYQARPQRVVSGPGAARHALGDEVARLPGRRVMLIAGPAELEVAQQLVAGLDVVAVFTGVEPHVPVPVAVAARAMASESGAEVLIAVGGGSTVGTAKAIALTQGLPILAVPTTYAGSEATDVWGLTDNGRKTNGADPVVLPRVIIYDPELTVTLPPGLTVSSGLNALAHCVDSLWGPSASPVSTALAVEGIRLLAGGLRDVLADGHDLVARAQCQAGTYLAAAAFAAAGSGMHHKICHVLGGAYNLEHAAMHAVLLPHILGFNAPAAPGAAQRIAGALQATGYGDGTDALAGLLGLYGDLGAPVSLGALGLAAEQVVTAATLALEKIPGTNPRPVTLAQLTDLLGRAQSGATPITVPLHL